jgi:hypothetical protein
MPGALMKGISYWLSPSTLYLQTPHTLSRICFLALLLFKYIQGC